MKIGAMSQIREVDFRNIYKKEGISGIVFKGMMVEK
jgi:hypothetical protein